MRQTSLLILGGNARVNLGVARCLGRLGIPIVVGARNMRGTIASSRYVSGWFRYLSLTKDIIRIHADIVKNIRLRRPRVLFPIFNPDWDLVYRFYDDYARLTKIVPSPGRKLFQDLSDKHRLVDYLEKYDLPSPRTFRPGTHAEAMSLREGLPYPVLLKPRGESGGIGIQRAGNPREYENVLSQQKSIPLIQEFIEGEELILNLLFDHGEPVAVSAYQVLRKYPLPYGPPIACRTIKDEALVNIGVNFLKKIGYHGFANLDFRVDRRDGQPKILEFNPRLSETIEISVRSGVNFPLMLYKLALGERVTPCFTYRVGLEFRWLLYGEILHLTQTPDKGATFRNLLSPGRFSSNISLLDPLPHIQEGAAIVRRGFSRLLSV